MEGESRSMIGAGDGARIAFHSDRDGDSEIWVVGSSGGIPEQLTANEVHDRDPSWSAVPTRTAEIPLVPGWNLVSWDVTPEDDRWFEAIAWSPDGEIIAAGTRSGLVCLFDAQDGSWLGEVAAHGAEITALCFDAKGRLATASLDGSIGIWQR